MAHKITNVKSIQEKSRGHQVEQINVTTYRVTSGGSGKKYTVRVQDTVKDGAVTYSGATCTCNWGKYRPSKDGRSGCSHVVAVFDHLEQTRTVSAWGTSQDAKRQRRPVFFIGDGVVLTSRKVTN